MADQLALDRQLCFALYAASRATTAVYRPLLDDLGITYPQYLVLLALWDRDGRTVTELGDALFLDSGTLSPLLKRLEAVGMLVRERSREDERRVLVHLTDSGRALRENACGISGTVAQATGMAPAEVAALRETLVRLTHSLHDRANDEEEPS